MACVAFLLSCLLALVLFLGIGLLLLGHLLLLSHLLTLELARLSRLRLSLVVTRIQLVSCLLHSLLELLLDAAVELSMVGIDPAVTELGMDEVNALRLSIDSVVSVVTLLGKHVIHEVAEVDLGCAISLDGHSDACHCSLTQLLLFVAVFLVLGRET